MDKEKSLFKGMANVSLWAEDVKAARDWYAEVFGAKAYFQKPDAEHPFYVEFRVGDYQQEVGIIAKKFMPVAAKDGPGGVLLYWHVDHVETTFERLIALGAKIYEPIIKRGEGFITASVLDPFGNLLGIMHNEHYLNVKEAKIK